MYLWYFLREWESESVISTFNAMVFVSMMLPLLWIFDSIMAALQGKGIGPKYMTVTSLKPWNVKRISLFANEVFKEHWMIYSSDIFIFEYARKNIACVKLHCSMDTFFVVQNAISNWLPDIDYTLFWTHRLQRLVL